MKAVFILLFFTVSFSCFSQATNKGKPSQNHSKTKAIINDKNKKNDGEMKTYYMVFLVKGDNRTQDSATAAQIQKQHLAHLDKLWKEGKLDIAGPFLDDEDTRGICIYNVKSIEEAKELAEADPAVKAGRLKVIVRAWYSMKGASLK